MGTRTEALPRPWSPARAAIAKRAVAAAPVLIPVFGHRYLPGDPCETGNPVYSVHQTDVIVYGHDLRSYWRNELGPIAERDRRMASAPAPRAIRFWSEVLAANGMEAVWKTDVVDFPAFIVVDEKGNDFFADLRGKPDVEHLPVAD